MAHGSVLLAESVTASVWAWGSFGASLAAIGGFGIIIWQLTCRQRRRKPPAPPRPHPDGSPPTPDEWDDYAIRVDQWAKDLGDD